ncbi:MAG: hypothetical protein JXA58_05730, partial [Dehalococcoidia bacterium]|nr:hypothetical protein [Dehalococcoidia bacterium]
VAAPIPTTGVRGAKSIAPKIITSLVIAAVAVFVGVPYIASGGGSIGGPQGLASWWSDVFPQKIASIITPKAPIGDLTPARDLKGTWISSLAGKGFQLYGSFTVAPGEIDLYEEGDMELVIESVEGNTATGQMRLTNVYGSSMTTIPGFDSISLPMTLLIQDSGYSPVSIRISGTNLDFGSFSAEGASGSMQGTYTTDLMSGTMTVETEYGPIKGEFHLMRQH